MNDVWMVAQGEYSDYRVIGIYITQDVAERAARLLRGQKHADNVYVTGQPLRTTPGLIRERSYRVALKRRSGEPTITEQWASESLDPDVGVQEVWATYGNNRAKHVVYYGEQSAAFACARAMSQQLHGEVIVGKLVET